uniref:Cation-transporting P-type ATPase N-terminal domain-containing protein n=1 Tax=Chlamydomonas leiostraca TaxID=1034604 RepID=A0A7S0WLK4_9CHLO|mmetsp:Transcript_18107/g.45593  ORF Transcript_18107/g.45593 Transcript_18107/m.45593 type:complete len:477 (+) Transcript_18107:118-1548(+)
MGQAKGGKDVEAVHVHGHHNGHQAKAYDITADDLYHMNAEKDMDGLRAKGGVEGLAGLLHSSTHDGLTEEGVAASSHTFGPNRYKEVPPKNFFKLAYETAQDPIIILLIVAAAVSTTLGAAIPEEREKNGWVEGVAIWIAVIIVICVGAGNDWQKDRQFRKLNAQREAIQVKVVRGGAQVLVNNTDVVVGDVLLLDTGAHFLTHHAESKAFALVSEVANSAPLKTSRMWLALGLGVAMVSTQILESFLDRPLINLWTAAILTGSLMMATGCMSGAQARGCMDWTVFICIGAAFGVGRAMELTGMADKLGSAFVGIVKSVSGRTAICSALYIATALLTEILSNNAAAALMYPVGAAAGDALGISPPWISFAIMFGSSSAFMSPFGYQCNLMVYAAGNYKTMQFVKFGCLMQVWMWIGVTLIFYFADTWYVMWIISGVLVAATLGGAWAWGRVPTPVRTRVETGLARALGALCFWRRG